MGQIPSRPRHQHSDPRPSATVPGSAGSRLKRVFGGRRKKSEDTQPNIPPTLLPVLVAKSRSLTTPASLATSSSSASKFPHQPTRCAGTYYTPPFIRHISPEHRPISSSNPSADPPPANPTQNPPSSDEVVGNVIQQPKKRDSNHDATKDDWRTSDSTTTSYYTACSRSVALGGTRTLRPVLMAESLPSTNTVVPVGKQLSVLLTDAEFVMTEEDVSHSGETPLSMKTAPAGSPKTSAAPPPGSEGDSNRVGFKRRSSDDMATLSSTAASWIICPSHNDDSQSTGTHIKGNLVALTTPPPTTRTVPQKLSSSQPGSFPQTTISMTSGLAPAAGFAMGFGKRAVEHMRRAFDSSGSIHNSNASTSLGSIASQVQRNKAKPHQTPNASSGAWGVTTVSSTFTGHTDPESFSFTGPRLGTCLRGPMRNAAGSPVVGGLVFGRDLKTCADETAIDAIRLTFPASDTSYSVLPALHERRLPALVFRCVQHIMKWGAKEEGLFRISGRATHVAKLRLEFDTGADFDISDCEPDQLDPHAVASVLKTYLRELPEPILTHALNPYFEAAMLAETNAKKSFEDQEAPVQELGASLPSGSRNGPLRKAPLLSTLAIPNVSGMRPPSQRLLNTLASLLARLPRENRDLLLTVIDVINFVVQQKVIRMSLSNLTFVFCPTLHMNAPIFRVLCEAEGIWNGPPDGWVDDSTTLDVKGDNVDAPESSQQMTR